MICADVMAEKVERLTRGEVPIREVGLDELVQEDIETGRLRFVLGPAAAVAGCELVYLCVPTPQRPNGSADRSHLEAAAAEIGPRLGCKAVMVTKSTVPVGLHGWSSGPSAEMTW